MKNSKRLINGLYLLFSGSFILASVIGLMLIIGLIGVVFLDDEEVHESYMKYQQTKGTDSLIYKSRFTVIKEEFEDISAGMKDGYDSAREAGQKTGGELAKVVSSKYNLTSSKEVRKEDLVYQKYMNRFEMIFIYLLVFLGIRECKRIFERLKLLVKQNQWFCHSIYKSLLRLAYIGIIFFVFKLSIEICNMILMSTPVEITGFTLDVIDYIEMLFNIAILFIIASVYKVGLDMHQEQELTI